MCRAEQGLRGRVPMRHESTLSEVAPPWLLQRRQRRGSAHRLARARSLPLPARHRRIRHRLVVPDEDLRQGRCAGSLARVGAGLQHPDLRQARRPQPVVAAGAVGRRNRARLGAGARLAHRPRRVPLHAAGRVAGGAEAAEGSRLADPLLLPGDRLARHQRVRPLAVEHRDPGGAVGRQLPRRHHRVVGCPRRRRRPAATPPTRRPRPATVLPRATSRRPATPRRRRRPPATPRRPRRPPATRRRPLLPPHRLHPCRRPPPRRRPRLRSRPCLRPPSRGPRPLPSRRPPSLRPPEPRRSRSTPRQPLAARRGAVVLRGCRGRRPGGVAGRSGAPRAPRAAASVRGDNVDA